MYELGQFVVHPGQGVCEVSAIESGPQDCYILRPVGDRHATSISFPVASEDRLRPILSADEARRLIDAWPSMEVDEHSERSIALEEDHYKAAIKAGSCEQTMIIAKTFLRRCAAMVEVGRKPPVAYERILKEARSRSIQELSVALGIDSTELEALFDSDAASSTGAASR